MENKERLIQVFFGVYSNEDGTRNHDKDKKYFQELHNSDYFFNDNLETLFGLPLWKPDGIPVYVWAWDYSVVSDLRFIVFGPFADDDEAKAAFIKIKSEYPIKGFMIINVRIDDAHAKYLLRYDDHNEWPHYENTDG